MYQTICGMKARDNRGFTLIELLIVIGIIAILAAIAIPQFAEHRQRAVEASMISDVRNAAISVEVVALDARTYAGLAVTGGPGPDTAVWAIGVVTSNSSLSRANTPSVVASTSTTYTIQMHNEGARTDRTNVTINEMGVIAWF